MKNEESNELYIYQKKSLLILLFLYYLNNIPYDCISLRSFGFHFESNCNFKAIVTSKKDHIHKYVVNIFPSTSGVNLEKLDVMGNVNIIKVKRIKGEEFYNPSASLNVYFDGNQFYAFGYMEGKEFSYLKSEKNNTQDNLLYYLANDVDAFNVNDSASSFILWLVKFYTNKLHKDLVMGAGINTDYGAKSWNSLIEALNNDFYKGNSKYLNEIKHYVGQEQFTSSMVLKTSGFNTYESLHHELYEFDEAKSFNDPDSTLYKCVDYIQRVNNISVITYNYDTNLEYLLKKRGLKYVTIYDDSSFTNVDVKVDIYHVHGLLPYSKFKDKRFTDSLIFNESDYYYLYNSPYSWNIAKQLHDFKFNACLFIGISLTDPDMKRILQLAKNYLKFNFIFLKKEKGYSEEVYSDLFSYFFSFDLIVIWVDEYEDIGKILEKI